jgi:hypothetical protein
MWQVAGVIVPVKRAICCSYHRYVECMQQVAAFIYDFQWRHSVAKGKLVNSIGIVTVMVLLTVNTIIFLNLVFYYLLSHIS